MAWDVIEHPVFSAWFKDLDVDAKESIYAVIRVLGNEGPKLGRPFVDSVKGSSFSNMKELRIQSLGRPFRVFFAFDPRRNALLLTGGNKRGDKRFYQKMIFQADKIYSDYLKGMDQ